MNSGPPALLALADGACFAGQAAGAAQEARGEVVFNTAMSGYQEILTDPSYLGQIVNFTCPHLGNYGVTQADSESPRPRAAGFICLELTSGRKQWRAERDLNDWLREHGVTGITGLDTRALTLHLRTSGAQNGVISAVDLDPESLKAKARAIPPMSGLNLASGAGCRESFDYSESLGNSGPKLAVLDFGLKKSILAKLSGVGFKIRVWPAETKAETLLASGARAVFLSNGPGDPAACGAAVETTRRLLGKLPLMGICLGHQIVALALGGQTYKLPFGHHGVNHPVRDLATGRVMVTSQNHGFCVAPDIFKEPGVAVTHLNANDQTVEGLSCPRLGVMTVQFHPEAASGPHDADNIFVKFREAALSSR